MVLLLGGLAAIAVTQLPTTGTGLAGSTTTGPGGVTSTTRPASTGALVAECVADYASVTAALSDYEALKGSAPPAGIAWATSRTAPGPYLRAWPNGDGRFTVRWNGTSLVVDPRHGSPSVGSSGTEAPRTGCDAL